MHKIFKRNGQADLFVFLGDGEEELLKLKDFYIDKKILWVSGNCDSGSMTKNVKIEILPDGSKMLYTHGNKLNVRYGTDKLLELAKTENARIALFGHTHCRYAQERDGVLLLNPGSAGAPRDGLPASYAWIDVLENGLVYNHVNL